MKRSCAAIVLGLLLSSCEQEKGTVIDSDVRVPFLRSASLTVSQVNLDDTIPSPAVMKMPDGRYEITDTLSAEVEDPRGIASIRQVSYRIYAPGSNQALASGKLDFLLSFVVNGSTLPRALYRAAFQFIMSRTEVGGYRIESFGIDQAGAESNHADLPLMIGRANSRPVLGIPTLREFSPPGSDSSRVTIAIPVSDSDGYADVAGVMIRAHNAYDSTIHDLADDGSVQSGDQLTGDGVFTTMLWVHPVLSFGEVQLEIVATDAGGALSAAVRRSLDNHPPVIVSLSVPDSILRPLSGSTPILFQLTAADPDGLQDIDSVYFRNYSAITPTNFLMFDDGQFALDGDQTAGDGIYSRIVVIDPSNTLGRKEFHFFVTDKSGATATIIKYITIY